ncbi:MAG: hypothetical protein WCB68_07700 [Pyrinomonadaceae bacterium]
MATKKGKYDTNPLDADYARSTDDVWGARHAEDVAPETEEMKGATRDVARTPNEQARQHPEAEAPTRRIDNAQAASYPSVFIPPTYQPPQVYQPPQSVYQPPPDYRATSPIATAGRPTSRTVSGIGLPENVTMILPYIPFHIGAVASVIELLIIPRQEVRARFHAAQGLALHLAVIAVSILFSLIGNFVNVGVGSSLFSVAALLFFIISIIRVWKGEPHRIAPLTDATQWLNGHIELKKK